MQKKVHSKFNKSIQSKEIVNKKTNVTLFEIIENWLTKNSNKVIGVIMLIGVLFVLLLFDVKISEGNDDSLYIEGGFNYATNFSKYYFTANAPFYPMLLGLLIHYFGINLILFKSINSIFFIIHLYILFLAFKKHIPLTVLFPVILFSAVNSFFLYFASQTYTESLFMLLQSIFFWAASMNVNALNKTNPKSILVNYSLLGFLGLLLIFCKTIAFSCILSFCFYFLINKQWKQLFYFTISFCLFYFSLELSKTIIWGDIAKSTQASTLFQVDPYDSTKGMETFSGFIDRFFLNSNLYISKRVFQILGFKNIDNNNTSSFTTLFVFILFSLSYLVIKRSKNNLLEFISYYIALFCLITFISLQTRWDQPRLILVIIPSLLLVCFTAIYNYLKNKNSSFQSIYIVLAIIILTSSTIVSISKANKNYSVLSKNMSGDIFYGYTPDWANYLKLSKWCSDSLPKSSLVACRKAPMSFVYGNGTKFFPVYNVYAVDPKTNLSNPDSVLSYFKRSGVTHVIIASLRRNPKKSDGYVINTLHRMLQPVAQKYPNKIQLVKQMGDVESAYLYKINY